MRHCGQNRNCFLTYWAYSYGRGPDYFARCLIFEEHGHTDTRQVKGLCSQIIQSQGRMLLSMTSSFLNFLFTEGELE